VVSTKESPVESDAPPLGFCAKHENSQKIKNDIEMISHVND
jgi:hypothetical protein